MMGYKNAALSGIFKFLSMFNTIVGAGAASRYGSAPQQWLNNNITDSCRVNPRPKSRITFILDPNPILQKMV
jgi:hypothetical protein